MPRELRIITEVQSPPLTCCLSSDRPKRLTIVAHPHLLAAPRSINFTHTERKIRTVRTNPDSVARRPHFMFDFGNLPIVSLILSSVGLEFDNSANIR